MGNVILTSILFKEDIRLQKTAVDHKYHVKNGDQGLYVRRIQFFLYGMGVFHKMYEQVKNQVGPMTADDRWNDMTSDMENMYYGNATAFGVWIYKDNYQIIGKGYQTIVDDIVGVMTIRHMDAMAKIYFKSAPSVTTRTEMAADAPNSLKPAIAAGMGVGSAMLSRLS